MSLTYPILSDICAVKINELTTLTKSMNSRLNEYKQKCTNDTSKMISNISTQNVKIDLIHNLFNEYKSSVGNNLNQKEIEELKRSQHNLINSIKSEYGQIIKNVNINIRDNNVAILEAIDSKLKMSYTDIMNQDLMDKIVDLEKKVEVMSTKKITNQLHTTVNSIHTELANINFRLNGLENNYAALSAKINNMPKKILQTGLSSNTSSQNNDKRDHETISNETRGHETISNETRDHETISNEIRGNETISNETRCHGTIDHDTRDNDNNWIKVTKKHKNKSSRNY